MERTHHCNVIQYKVIVGVQISGGRRLRIQELGGRRNVVSNFYIINPGSKETRQKPRATNGLPGGDTQFIQKTSAGYLEAACGSLGPNLCHPHITVVHVRGKPKIKSLFKIINCYNQW